MKKKRPPRDIIFGECKGQYVGLSLQIRWFGNVSSKKSCTMESKCGSALLTEKLAIAKILTTSVK